MHCTRVSIDLAKNKFQLCGIDLRGEYALEKKVSRGNVMKEMSKLESTLVVMEACYSSNYWGRELEKLGHEVKLIPAFAVKPFLLGNKTDKNDARAILEASFRSTIRTVPVKTLEQQDIQSLFRIRESLVKMRTMTINQLRGLLSEYGVVLAKGRGALSQVPGLVEDTSNGLTYCARDFCTQLYEQVKWLTEQIEVQEQKLQALLLPQVAYHRLLEVPGIGPIVTAMLLAAPDASSFKNGRQFAAWMGLTPKCFASGEVSQMRGLSKRGNKSLRRLLIHGARTVFTWCDKGEDPFRQWCQALKKRLPSGKAIVAIANKLARIAWAILAKKQPYCPALACGR